MRNIKPPTLGEVIELRQQMPNSLESRAASINRHIDLFSRAQGTWQAHRVRAGFELIEARKLVEKNGLGWEAWCAENIHRSFRDIQKMMAMARTGDPEAAAEKERSRAREGMRAHRAANVSRPADRTEMASIPLLADYVFQLFLQLGEAERAKFLALIEEERKKQ
jgi:hypothetical protein